MATTISTQDIVDAKRDIDDIGKAVNEKVIVSPRYGGDFKSLPMVAAEAQATIGEWQDAINTIVVDDGVPALAVSDASGVTQQEVNDIVLDPNLAPLGWTQQDFNDQFVDVRKFIKKDLSNATAGLQAAIEAAYGGTLLIPIPLTLLDTMHIERGLNILGTQSAVTNYATDVKRLNFASLAPGQNAFSIAKTGDINGFSMSNLYLRGAKSGGSAIDTGGSISAALKDFTFNNITINNFSTGIKQTYSWAGEFNRVRVQGCTNGIEYNSQCNAIQHNATSVVTIDGIALKHTNAEGIQYNSCNISNLTNAASPITFFQSTAVFVNAYLENITAESAMTVGSTNEDVTLPSSVIIIAPKKLGKNITTATHRNHVEISGYDANNISVVGASISRETKAVVSGNNAIGKINRVLDRLASGQIRLFSTSGSAALTYATKRGYTAITNTAATSGIRLASGTLTIGKTYTLSLAVRAGAGGITYAALNGQGTTEGAAITQNTDEVRIQNFTFVAKSANLNLWFTGELEFYGFQIQEGNLTSFDAPFNIQPSLKAGEFEALSEPTGVTNWVIGDKIINRGGGNILYWEATSATVLKAISKVVGLTPTSTAAQIVAAMQAAGIAT